jgi:8-oxo-dGTP diphosphatase
MRRIHVVAAVIRNADNAILIAKRPADKHQGGLWEFPGGKVEAGESPQQALARELEEELGITPTVSHPLIRIAHDYPDKQVLLDVWQVSAFAGEPHGREQQPLRWVAPQELPAFAFPAANLPIITAARLPERLLITPDPSDEPQLLDWLARRLQRGISLVLLRAKSLDDAAYRALAISALALCRAHGAALLLHGHAGLLATLEADGVHVDSTTLMQLPARPVSAAQWFSAATHNAAELQQAMRLGADFVTLSPVQGTASHPGVAGMGWGLFAELVGSATLPVYALGGMSAADLEQAWAAGAQGIAGISHLA